MASPRRPPRCRRSRRHCRQTPASPGQSSSLLPSAASSSVQGVARSFQSPSRASPKRVLPRRHRRA
eukprot:1040654-Rhodomonas_salina.1